MYKPKYFVYSIRYIKILLSNFHIEKFFKQPYFFFYNMLKPQIKNTKREVTVFPFIYFITIITSIPTVLDQLLFSQFY